LFSILLMTQGLHPHRDISHANQNFRVKLKDESLVFSILMSTAVDHIAELMHRKNDLLNVIPDLFFSEPIDTTDLMGDSPEDEVTIRKIISGKYADAVMIVDEHPEKSLGSMLRKYFKLYRGREQNDKYSVNIAVANKTGLGRVDSIQTRIEFSENIFQEMCVFAENVLNDKVPAKEGKHYSVYVHDSDPNGSLAIFMKIISYKDERKKRRYIHQAVDMFETSGSRTGSFGDKILRTQKILAFKDNLTGEIQFLEVNVFPFENNENRLLKQAHLDTVTIDNKKQDLFLHFYKKTKDTADGGYDFRRLVARNSLDPSGYSPMELFYFAKIYPEIIDIFKKHHIKRQKHADLDD
jgi:hypothetical protein